MSDLLIFDIAEKVKRVNHRLKNKGDVELLQIGLRAHRKIKRTRDFQKVKLIEEDFYCNIKKKLNVPLPISIAGSGIIGIKGTPPVMNSDGYDADGEAGDTTASVDPDFTGGSIEISNENIYSDISAGDDTGSNDVTTGLESDGSGTGFNDTGMVNFNESNDNEGRLSYAANDVISGEIISGFNNPGSDNFGVDVNNYNIETGVVDESGTIGSDTLAGRSFESFVSGDLPTGKNFEIPGSMYENSIESPDIVVDGIINDKPFVQEETQGQFVETSASTETMAGTDIDNPMLADSNQEMQTPSALSVSSSHNDLQTTVPESNKQDRSPASEGFAVVDSDNKDLPAATDVNSGDEKDNAVIGQPEQTVNTGLVSSEIKSTDDTVEKPNDNIGANANINPVAAHETSGKTSAPPDTSTDKEQIKEQQEVMLVHDQQTTATNENKELSEDEAARNKLNDAATSGWENHPKACNFSTAEAAKAMGHPELDNTMKANEQIKYMEKNWTAVDAKTAQDLANKGVFVVAGRPDTTTGHTVVVVPGELKELHGKEYPMIKGGAQNAYARERSGGGHSAGEIFKPKERDEIKYYTPPSEKK